MLFRKNCQNACANERDSIDEGSKADEMPHPGGRRSRRRDEADEMSRRRDEAGERSRGGTEADEVPRPGEVAWSDEAGEMLRPEARGWRRERGGLLACKRIAAD